MLKHISHDIFFQRNTPDVKNKEKLEDNENGIVSGDHTKNENSYILDPTAKSTVSFFFKYYMNYHSEEIIKSSSSITITKLTR